MSKFVIAQVSKRLQQATAKLNGLNCGALTAFVLGAFINPQEPARAIAKIAGIAALFTVCPC